MEGDDGHVLTHSQDRTWRALHVLLMGCLVCWSGTDKRVKLTIAHCTLIITLIYPTVCTDRPDTCIYLDLASITVYSGGERQSLLLILYLATLNRWCVKYHRSWSITRRQNIYTFLLHDGARKSDVLKRLHVCGRSVAFFVVADFVGVFVCLFVFHVCVGG